MHNVLTTLQHQMFKGQNRITFDSYLICIRTFCSVNKSSTNNHNLTNRASDAIKETKYLGEIGIEAICDVDR